jgi:cyclopropane fatty-acyl-phospholipid synthase-like methyltransferase
MVEEGHFRMSWNITDVEKLEDAIIQLKLRLVRKIGVRSGMTVVDLGCGQGGFTTALAKTVGENGKVLAVDISDKYLGELMERLEQHGVKNVVTFVRADAANLEGFVPDEVADVVASYRLLEELKHPKDMGKIIKGMARIVRRGGKVGFVELCTEPKNEAEDAYIRLHRESGDSLFEPDEIVEAMRTAELADIRVEKVETDVWFSPVLAKQDLSHAQVWFDADVEKSLGGLIDKYGMKYPALLVFSGAKK